MENNAKNMEEITDIRKGKKSEPLTKVEMKLYRKFNGKLSWLAENCRPDLCFTALEMSRKNGRATLDDLKNINKTIKKVKGRSSRILLGKVGEPDDLIVYAIGDAAYKSDEKAVGGELVLLGNKKSDKAIAIYWKSKTVRQVCHSAKDAETRNIVKLVDTSRFMTNQIEEMLFEKKKKIPIKIFSDSIPTLESIASTSKLSRNC